MYIKKDISLAHFEFWSGANELAKRLSVDELMLIEFWLEELSEETKKVFTETEVNDFFWFDQETIAKILGFQDEDTMWDDLVRREV